jgi:hypothetical protein
LFVEMSSRASPADFAGALAAASVCAGVVSGTVETVDSGTPWHLEPGGPQVRLGSMLRRFESEGRGTIHQYGDFIVIAVGGTLSDYPSLDRHVSRFEVHGKRTISALQDLIQALRPGEQIPGGEVGSILGPPGEPPADEDAVNGPYVSVLKNEASVLELLIAIGIQSPGVVWRVAPEMRGHPSPLQLSAVSRSGRKHVIGLLPPY